jgi:superfamily II DNA/RNA helicase
MATVLLHPDVEKQLQSLPNDIEDRVRSKLADAIDLAKRYLTEREWGAKVVMFAMDIDTTEQIAAELREVSDKVFLAHSKLASSSAKKDRLVRQQIDAFARADQGVLVAPKLLDEGIDVPDAEVGINVAGTKTKLQLVQRMERVLRKHGDKRPHFHHYVAVPDDFRLEGLDAKEYVQEISWVRELGEQIGQEPVIERASIDQEVRDRAEQRGNELWARDLLADLGVETVQGTLHLDELIEDLTLDAARLLSETVDLGGKAVAKRDWKAAMATLREDTSLSASTLQRVWWLFPLYRERPGELAELLDGVIETRIALDSPDDPPEPDTPPSAEPGASDDDAAADDANREPVSTDGGQADTRPADSQQATGVEAGETADAATKPEPADRTNETAESRSDAESEDTAASNDPSDVSDGVLATIRRLFDR